MSAKVTSTARKIVRSFNIAACDHRVDFEHCPSCDAKFETEIWDKAGILLILEEVYGKHGSVAVVSECPKCFEKSWVHHEFHGLERDYANEFPIDWRKAAAEEHTRRHVASVHRFADSLCVRCIHLRKLECDTLPIINCTYGENERAKSFYMHSSFTETVCPKFQPR